LTPQEIALCINAAAQRQKLDRNRDAWLAWHIEALHRMKKLPKLKAMLTDSGQKQAQSWEEQYAIAQQWIARTGMLKGED
jgi:hypothetical protein